MPASGRFLLDTNIVIALLAGDDTVLSHLDHAPEVFIPAVVLGELFFGAAKSDRQSENARWSDSQPTVRLSRATLMSLVNTEVSSNA
jgi:tRNA(fMet)-specific endonuclease VapC